MSETRRLIVGMTGASGAIYGVRILEALRALGWESHLVVSRAARRTIGEELDIDFDAICQMATTVHAVGDIGASIASGSFRTDGMVIAPCSIRTAGEIAACTTTSLLTRAADVVLKERRRLVLMVRETPLHLGHLRMLTSLAETGAIIAPPVPAFYIKPEAISDLVDHSVGRVLDLFGIPNGLAHRWKESAAAAPD